MSRIFISHSHLDNAAALAVGRWLESCGWDGDYYLDISASQGMAPGERWQAALKAAADRCEAVLFLISPAWRDSIWCLAEFLLAKQLGKAVFGVLIEATPFDSLPRELTAEWQLCDLVSGQRRRVIHVFQDPIIPETDISFAQDGLDRLEIGLKKAGLDASSFRWPPENDPERAPYRGLKALEAEDAAVFFGRDAEIVRGLDSLRGLRERGVEKMLVILGASGAGKSSFLRAGLWPRLARNDRNFLPLPVIRPERAAITGAAGLAAALERALQERGVKITRAQIRATLDKPGGLDGLLNQLQAIGCSRLGPGALPPTVVVSVDQVEELFGTEGHAEAEMFLEMLGHVLAPAGTRSAEGNASRQRPLALIAIRSDSYERLQTEPRLERIAPYLFSLPPISRAEFKTVIEGPAEVATKSRRSLRIEPALTQRLLRDTEGADALPLLGFTLERLLVEHGGDGDLRLDEYEAMGGVRGSIQAAVDAALARPGSMPSGPAAKAERERCLRLGFIPWLASVDPETEERKRRVARWDEIPAEAQPLLELLIEQRLLIRDRRKVDGSDQETRVVEVAHEALLRQWPSLTAWLDEDADALKTLDATRRAAAEWRKNDYGVAWLVHTSGRLLAAEALMRRPDFDRVLGIEGQAYLRACREREREYLRTIQDQVERVALAQRRIAVLLALIAIILAGANGWIVLQTRALGRQTSLVLASAAQAASSSQLHDRALRYGLLAARDGWLSPAAPEAEAQLVRAANASLLSAGLAQHKAAVTAAAFSPDGRRVVTASADSTARLWDADTGQPVATLSGHLKGIVSAVFSPDNRRIVTTSTDKTARVWDAHSGELLATLLGHLDSVVSASFSADGRRILTASRDSTARVWDTETGQTLSILSGHQNTVVSAAFSQDARRIVTASEDTTGRVWDAHTGRLVATLAGHGDWVVSGEFSPDQRRIVTASWDRTARVWDARTGRLIATLEGHEDKLRSATFSPNGQRVLTASFDHTARVWDVQTRRAIAVLAEHENAVNSAVFSGDGRRVVTASFDNTARVWDAETGQSIATLAGHEGPVNLAAFGPDGKAIVTASDDTTARLWVQTGQPIATLIGHENAVNSAAFSADGKRIVTAASDHTVRVWDARSGHLIATLKGHAGPVNSAALSPDGKQVVTGSDDATARVWDMQTGRLIATLGEHQLAVNSAVFSPDGREVVTASDDTMARVWDTQTGQLITTLAGHDDWVRSAAFSPDGLRVLTASEDGTARLWDTRTGRLILTLVGHREGLRSAAFSPDGRRIVTASSDHTARVWDARTGESMAALTGHQDVVNAAAFSPDGRRILTASSDKTARVWHAQTGQLISTMSGHAREVSAGAFSPDGQRIVTASLDQTAKVWDARWLIQEHGNELFAAVCIEKLRGAHTLTGPDVAAAPILRGREGNDVCEPPSLLARGWDWVHSFWKRALRTTHAEELYPR